MRGGVLTDLKVSPDKGFVLEVLEVVSHEQIEQHGALRRAGGTRYTQFRKMPRTQLTSVLMVCSLELQHCRICRQTAMTHTHTHTHTDRTSPCLPHSRECHSSQHCPCTDTPCTAGERQNFVQANTIISSLFYHVNNEQLAIKIITPMASQHFNLTVSMLHAV